MSSDQSSAKRNVVAGIALLTAALLISMLLVEVLLRIYAGVSTTGLAEALRVDLQAALVEPHGQAGYRPRSGSVFQYDNGTAATTNEMGFRGPEVSVPKPRDTYRIALLGGSTTFGWGVDDDETIDAHMREILAERYPGSSIEVVNLAFDGYDSFQLYQRLKSDGLRLEPDVIIVNTGVNDVRNAWHTDIRDGDPRTLLYRATMEQLRRQEQRGAPTLWTRVKHHLYLARLPGWLRSQISGSAPGGPGSESLRPFHWEALDYFERNVERMIESAARSGAQAILLSTPPSSLRTRYAPTDPPIRSYWLHNAETTQVYRDSLSTRLELIAGQQPIGEPVVVRFVPHDDLPPEMFLDDAHLTPRGNRVVAQDFVTAVEPLLAEWIAQRRD